MHKIIYGVIFLKRSEVLERLGFTVPDIKKKRVLILSDIACEADDQFALVHHLLTPSEDIVGIVACNFERRHRAYQSEQPPTSMDKSYAEGKLLLELMGIDDVPILKGAPDAVLDPNNLPVSEGSDFIIKEAMRDCDSPLYIAIQGAVTDLTVAYLTEPKIAEKIEAAIWIGGRPYPNGGGGHESNLQKDIYSANVLFESSVNVWQVPVNAYATAYLSLSELMTKVRSRGEIGKYIVDRMLGVNEKYGQMTIRIPFPHGEVWSIGDQPTITVLLQSESGSKFHMEHAPHINDDLTYTPNPNGKLIRVYDSLDQRLTMDDFFAKLELCYRNK